MNVDVPNGLYEMWVGYRSQFGQKGYNYRVDNESGTGMFDQSSTFSTDRAGLFNVTGGTNTLGIYKDWGYYDVDYLEFRPFTPPAIQPISAQLSDPLANQNTQMLMNYLTGIYGQKTLAGHQHDGSKNLPFPSSTYLNLSGGLKPAIRASDFIEYSPTRIQYGANPNNESEQSIAWAKQNNGILSMSWHWNAPANLVNSGEWPWWRGFYTEGTTFNLPGARQPGRLRLSADASRHRCDRRSTEEVSDCRRARHLAAAARSARRLVLVGRPWADRLQAALATNA